MLVFRDENETAVRKRPARGLLAGMYEFPNVEGHLTREEVIGYGKKLGLAPIRVKPLPAAKHIFSHVEWHMIGYEVLVDELEREMKADVLFAAWKNWKKNIRCLPRLNHICRRFDTAG